MAVTHLATYRSLALHRGKLLGSCRVVRIHRVILKGCLLWRISCWISRYEHWGAWSFRYIYLEMRPVYDRFDTIHPFYIATTIVSLFNDCIHWYSKIGYAEHKPLIDESIYHTKDVLSPPAQIFSFSVRIIDLPINPLIEWSTELLATLYACSFLNWDLGLVLSDRSTWSRPGLIYRRTHTG